MQRLHKPDVPLDKRKRGCNTWCKIKKEET